MEPSPEAPRPTPPRFARGDGSAKPRFVRSDDPKRSPHYVDDASVVGEGFQATIPQPTENRVRRPPRKYTTPYRLRRKIPHIDGRTVEAALMQKVRRDLIAHVGGHPSATQKALIERAVWVSLKLELLDREIAAGKAFGEYHTHIYLSWTNTLARLLRQLGLDSAKPPSGKKSLGTYLEAAE